MKLETFQNKVKTTQKNGAFLCTNWKEVRWEKWATNHATENFQNCMFHLKMY